MRPALVEFGGRVRQMERPVGREIDDGSWKRNTPFARHERAPALPSSPDTLLDVRGLRPARFHPLGIEGGLLGVLYEKISNALAPLGNSGC
jgi:hypothetical protein